MVKRIKKLKKIRIHREGNGTLIYSFIIIAALGWLLWEFVPFKLVFCAYAAVTGFLWLAVLNFYRCPIRNYPDDTTGIVVAPADGKVVVNEIVDETKYFNDKRLMISIFMSPLNVHANWFPVDGKVKSVEHFDGNYHRAWLPKASEENEHADIVITTPEGHEVLCRQIAGAVARRIVTYVKPEEECCIDEHIGFIKLGSRVDVYLPLCYKSCVKIGQSTTGDLTVIAKLKETQV